jgi:Fe-S-cluster containining protein
VFAVTKLQPIRTELKKLNTQMDTLTQLHIDIAVRVEGIQLGQPDWPCRMGCDGCCRRLAEIPRLTETEWECLQEGLAVLSAVQLRDISVGVAALAGQTSRPIVCPLLDQSAGACRVYAHRPVACRTYGFYVQRDLGLYCNDIESRVADGGWAGVVWGNHDPIDRRLSGLGDTRELTDWFACWVMADTQAFNTQTSP